MDSKYNIFTSSENEGNFSYNIIINNGIVFSYYKFLKQKFKGIISIYKYKDIEIEIPKNKKIFKLKDEEEFDNYYFYLFINRYALYLLSNSSSKIHYNISEKVYIKFQKFINYYEFDLVYKNGIYIIKNKFMNLEYNLNDLNSYESINIILKIISKIGNKFNLQKLNLLKGICDKCNIEYKITKDEIEIFLINEIEYKEDRAFEGELYSLNDYYILSKIGKYSFFI